MTKEDYVSLEVAKKLKEKGFNDPCHCYYCNDENKCFYAPLSIFDYELLSDGDFLMPSLYDAQKWLREKHNIDVLPTIREESLPKKDYCCYIYKDAKVVHCKVAYVDDFYECMNDSLLESLNYI